ncbi:hypothetical protein MKW94_009306 [Papaver nudicaule]|uniref:Uncharacterized protein n=1 Tax=Papaver nudicaule TaxID=74823 RepID=A0AA41RZS3_PAPNU|nr:hypothetical protein [Papaver nudicaule]
MDSSSSSPSPLIHPLTSPIPVDLFVSKKRLSLNLKFNDACGNLVFRVDDQQPTNHDRVLLDANNNPLIFIDRNTHGGWEGFGSGGELIFKVEKKFVSKLWKGEIELDVYQVSNGGAASAKDAGDVIKVKGSPFHRSCTIYRGNSIMAQTSLLYKLGKLTTGRRKFRVTMFPGLVDQALIVSLIVIFFDR